jgi:cytochrome P450
MIILPIVVYYYLKWKYYTLRSDIPGLQPEFKYGNLRQLGIITSKKQVTDSYVHAFGKMQKQYGDVFQIWIGSNHYYVFCRPEHAERIYSDRHIFDRADVRTKTFGLIAEDFLITLVGSKYKRHAKAIVPMLRKHRFKSQISIIINYVDQLIQIWKDRYENQDDFICTSILSDNEQLMLDTFTRLTFDYDLGNLNHLSKSAKRPNPLDDKIKPSELSVALTIWLDALRRVTTNGMPSFVNDFLLKIDKKYQNALRVLQSNAENIIRKCQEEIDPNNRPENLVASLVSSLQKDEELERKKPEKEQTGITKRELIGEVLGLILGGYETSATILACFIYYVSQKYEVQQKIKEELKQHNITKETSLDNFDLLDQCQYIDCVLKETLRLAITSFGSPRTLLDDTIIDGFQMRKGDTVVSSFSLMQRDSRYWKLDPTQFIPQRFFGLDAPDANHNPFVFAPFGGGHRGCVGQDLARLELKVIIIRYMLFVTFVDAPVLTIEIIINRRQLHRTNSLFQSNLINMDFLFQYLHLNSALLVVIILRVSVIRCLFKDQ